MLNIEIEDTRVPPPFRIDASPADTADVMKAVADADEAAGAALVRFVRAKNRAKLAAARFAKAPSRINQISAQAAVSAARTARDEAAQLAGQAARLAEAAIGGAS